MARHPRARTFSASGPQQRSRTALLRARFERLSERFPDDPGAYTYHGEMLLWIGDYEASIEQFKLAIGRKHLTIWAWIGWGAALALLGKGDEALNKLSEGIEEANFEGPTVYVYRGEIHRRAGRLEQARSELLGYCPGGRS